MPEFMTLLGTAILSLIGGMILERLRSQEWLKQERWQYKRDTYEELFAGLFQLVQIYKDFADPETYEDTSNEQLREMFTNLGVALRKAELFLDPTVIKDVHRIFGTFPSLPKPNPGDSSEHRLKRIKQRIDAITELNESIAESAVIYQDHDPT